MKKPFGMDYLADKTMHRFNVDKKTAEILIMSAYRRSLESDASMDEALNNINIFDVIYAKQKFY